MGIPKFYRWLSERYPLLNQKLTLTEGPPEIDNLYLDMNGIIHNCTHANRKDIGNVTEEDMMLKVFAYLEKLIQIVRPQKLLFMAIDGVAPRAKMNQQRSRRFKSAMERIKNEEEQRRKGEVVPEDAFDSNCITPGTAFMARLGQHLRFFIRRKMAEDPLWQKPTVVFSGHEVPGEGEHKIMEYIRWEKRQPSYAPNQRHCMYGLDADLIMLSLVTHEPHFCLLREVVSYTGSNRGQPAREVLDNPCAENFILFQIGLLREYFELEFGSLKLPFALDLERVVDDYVLMCMLVGNDFLPALPTLDIAEGALNKLMELYKELLPKMGGYLTFAGELDRRRLEMLLERLGQMELETLEERAQDAEFMEAKRAKRNARLNGNGNGNGGGGGVFGSRNQLDEIDAGMRSLAGPQPNIAAILDGPLEPEGGGGGGGPAGHQQQQQNGPTMMSREARQMMMAGLGADGLQLWKDRYYSDKLHAPSPEERRQVVEHYVSGLHWVLEYYYRGVASWDWYYPYHYAPMASDLTNLDSIQVAFAQGTPFRPFEQLLAVLPAASAKLLPPAFRVLMTDPESPIVDFYPATFQVDMEGKRADWEGVVLVPFVDEVRLLQAVRSIRTALLSPEELARNKLGQIQIYQFSRNTSEPTYCSSTMPKHFTDIKVCHSRCLERPPPPPLPPGGKGFTPVLVPGTRVGLQTPTGMPTLKSLQVRPTMRNAGVNVLGTASRKESLVLGLKDLRQALGGAVLGAEQVAASGLLGSRAYINWPYLQEARVVRVADRNGQACFDKTGALKVQKWTPQEVPRWETDAGQLAGTFLSRCGIDVGKVDLVVGVKVCLGYIRHSDGTIEKTYSKDEVQVPLQAVIRQRPQQAAGGAAGAADDVPGFPDLQESTQVVFLGKHHFGCLATVMSDLEKGLARQGRQQQQPKRGAAAPNGHYRLLVQPVGDEVGFAALRAAKRVVERFTVKYYTSGEVAGRVGISPRLLGRVTGNMWARDGDDRYDLGLAVKTSSRDVCVPGFSQPTEDGNGWTYSAAVILILQEYRKKFPWLWNMLTRTEGEGAGDIRLDSALSDLRPDQRKERVREVTDWIKSTPLAKRPLVKLGVKVLSDEGVRALVMTAPNPARPPPAVEYENVPPVLMLLPYTPGPDQVKLAVQGGPFELGDRVICVSAKGSPPYGLRGTVIGVYGEACEVLFDEDFGGGSDLNGRLNGGKRGAFVPKDLLVCINIPVEISLDRHQVPRQQQQQPQGKQAGAVSGAKAAAAALQQGSRQGSGAGTADAAAVKAARKAMQQLSVGTAGPSAPATSPCVPSSVAVTAPVSPPVPSSKLLGAAMKAAVGQQPPPAAAAGRAAQQHQRGPADAGAGKALLMKLTKAGQASSSAAQQQRPAAATAVAAVAAATATTATGAAAGVALAAVTTTAQGANGAGSPLDQLKKVVPNARVDSGLTQRHSQPAPQQQPPPQGQAPPPPPPPHHMAGPPYPAEPMLPGGMMPPPMPQHAPYMMGGPGFHPQQQPPMFFPPPFPPGAMGPPGGHGMPPHTMMMPPPPPPGVGPAGMMGPHGGAPYFMPYAPGMGMPPPPQPFQGPPVASPPPPPPPPQGFVNGSAGVPTGNAQQPAAVPQPPPPPQDSPRKALAEGQQQRPGGGNAANNAAADPRRKRNPPASSSPAAAAPASAPAPQAPSGAAATSRPRPAAPQSHPIEVGAVQGGDDTDQGAAAAPSSSTTTSGKPVTASVASGSAPRRQAAPQGASAAGGGGSSGPSVAAEEGGRPVPVGGGSSAFGKSARLPDASGRGFRGRGKPVGVSTSPPAAPGSLASTGAAAAAPTVAGATAPAPAASATGGRYSLDYANAGQALLRSLQTGSGSSQGAGVAAASQPAAAAEAPVGGASIAASTGTDSNPGAALLRQLQRSSTGDVDAALKSQSLDSGTELLRALQRAQQPPQPQAQQQ